jgi:hypothetical protein
MQDREPRPICRLLVTAPAAGLTGSTILTTCSTAARFHLRNAPSARNSAGTENAKLIAASVIAAIRLNREEIKDAPTIHAKIRDSLKLADMIVSRSRN